ncbi:MAG: AI-2E family transporter [Paludibacteraceae bacterium]
MEKIFSNKPYTFDRVIRMIIIIGIITLIYFIVRKLSSVLLPFVIGFLLAYYLNPFVLFFQNKLKIKNRGLAICCTLLLFLLAFAGILWIIIPQIVYESQRFSALVSNYTQNINLGTILSPQWQAQINEFIARIDIKELLSNETFTGTVKNIFPKLWSFINGSVSFLLSLVVIIFVFIYMIFILIDYEKIKSEMFLMVPIKYRKITEEIFTDTKNAMNQYFRGQGLVALLTGIILMIGLSIIGLPMAIVIGALMGILNMIPYMQGLGLIPCALMGILRAAETGQNLWMVWLSILIVFIIAQAIQDYILVPRIMKKVTGLRPAMVLLSLSVWGSLMGIIGMIIALPLTVVLLAYYKRFVLNEERKEPQAEEAVVDSADPESKEQN